MILPGIGGFVPVMGGIEPSVFVIRASSQESGTTFTPTVAPLASGTTLLVAIVSYRGNTNISAGAGWTEVTQVNAGALGGIALFSRVPTGSDTLTISNANNSSITAHVYVITSSGATVLGASVTGGDPPSLTATWTTANTFWLAGVSHSATAPTAPVGFGHTLDTSAQADARLTTADRVDSSATVDPATFTGGGTLIASLTVAVQPG